MSPYIEYESPVLYESPMSNDKKVMCRVNVFIWCHQRGLVIKNTHAKYESPMSNGKKVMCKVEVFQM